MSAVPELVIFNQGVILRLLLTLGLLQGEYCTILIMYYNVTKQN